MGFVKDIFKAGQLTPSQFWSCSLLPLGQLYARIEYYNGSLDHPWLMFPLFMMPPFQFVPIIMMNLGMIKKGKGGKPYDWWMAIPILIKFGLAYMAFKGTDIDQTVLFGILYCGILIPFLIRSYGYCNGVNIWGFLNCGALSAFVIMALNLFVLILPFMPVIGAGVNVLESVLPVIGGAAIWSLGFIPGYVVSNMYTSDERDKFCSKFNYNIFAVVVSLSVAFFTGSISP